MLQAKMKKRHLTMIAVVSVQVFSSGSALKVRGPAAILIGWIIMGVMLVNAIGEISILYPLSGGFAKRFLDPGFALAMGWNYFLQWAVVLPLEITAARTTVQYWTEKVFIAVWITVFWVVVMIICLFGTLDYAEEKFWSSCLKLLIAAMFIFIGIICGGGPTGGQYDRYIGGALWQNPGAFANGFQGVCSVFITAAFAFSRTELVGLAATASPFVIVLDNAKIPGLNHLVNATISPRFFTYVDKSSRPLFSVIALLLFAPIASVNLVAVGDTVCELFLISRIRFRRAWKVQGHSVEELLFKALGGVWGSWLGLILIVIVLIAPFHVKSPLDTMRKGYDENKDLERQREEQRINDEALDAARAEQAKARTGVMQIEKKIKKGEKALDSKVCMS
ncbi:amino acid permease-domain-containing protein [Lentinula detonsa]|uniref:Amino acid permease-domain-containing protein n=1 Tax=Lentinula detonsa TaxID=2804962 RepID=A0A9W8NQ35_9AGAR|nr:amino acid permease-domain-containing protein [Lentinula detonsa]